MPGFDSTRASVTAGRGSAPRRSKTCLAAGLVVAALGFAAPAQAQFGRGPFGYEPDFIMPPRAVAWRLSERGFTEIERPRFDGRAYVVEASSPYGDRVRLFVDARDGAILGRQRLGAPVAPPARLVARPSAPGYGYTEDEAEPRRPIRQAERLLPPADIPGGGGLARQPRSEPYPRREIDSGREGAARPEPIDRNPTGLNPDAKPRPEPQRKAARLAPPARPAAPRAAPEAPRPGEAAQSPAKPESAKPEPAEAASPPTPASVQPPPPEKPSVEAAAQAWTNPPGEGKRPVRVIGGATVVPGAGDKAAPAN